MAKSFDWWWESLGDRPYGCTPLQKAFVYHSLRGLSDPMAVVGAGYSPNYAAQEAYKLRNNPKVRALHEAALRYKEADEEGFLPESELVRMATRWARSGSPENKARGLQILATYYGLLNQADRDLNLDGLIEMVGFSFGPEFKQIAAERLGVN